MKQCSRCKKEKELSEFNNSSHNRQGKQPVCRACQSSYYESNRDKHLANVAARRRRHRDWIRSLKEGQPCAQCGRVGHPHAMHWHHRDPSQKEFNLSIAVAASKGRQKVLDEIAKCDLLCADCHAIVHDS